MRIEQTHAATVQNILSYGVLDQLGFPRAGGAANERMLGTYSTINDNGAAVLIVPKHERRTIRRRRAQKRMTLQEVTSERHPVLFRV